MEETVTISRKTYDNMNLVIQTNQEIIDEIAKESESITISTYWCGQSHTTYYLVETNDLTDALKGQIDHLQSLVALLRSNNDELRADSKNQKPWYKFW